ncbi:hypothetical protein FHT17_004764 [Novosphingobium sp. SG916]|nr:hypothetical protein [Novosphingobium sp. SG919]NMN89831.1 hypothetical protein [Novosphingobium sp. SG916]
MQTDAASDVDEAGVLRPPVRPTGGVITGRMQAFALFCTITLWVQVWATPEISLWGQAYDLLGVVNFCNFVLITIYQVVFGLFSPLSPLRIWLDRTTSCRNSGATDSSAPRV